MKTTPQPYLGLTGVKSVSEIPLFGISRPDGARYIMAGVLASEKTVNGGATTNRRYPHRSEIAPLVRALTPHAWPVIHYNGPVKTMRLTLMRLAEDFDEGVLPGVQLNVCRPTPSDMSALAAHVRPETIVLQVNGSSLDTRTPEAVDAYVSQFEGLVGHALLDLSGGTGRGMDVPWMLEILTRYATQWSDMGIRIGLAGGLGPGDRLETIRDIMATLRRTGRTDLMGAFSIDAESGIRRPVQDPIAGEKYQDTLDLGLATQFIRDADAIFAQAP